MGVRPSGTPIWSLVASAKLELKKVQTLTVANKREEVRMNGNLRYEKGASNRRSRVIGCHLTEHLLRDGHTVTVIGNFSTGRSENLATVKDHKGLELIELDIVNDQLENFS